MSLFNFFEIWEAIIINVLMTFLILIMCQFLVSFFFLLLFSPHCGLYISALLHLPVNFFADTRYCEFYLIACVYFYITINILECCSGMCLPYMETD